ncbi:MMPL family transporter [Nocardioides pinisoli]|uniref:MMPL family transporter n=1 Tax=Nocardioides pinisoli TaxID=2950279 RepID=A0ABT1KXD7_9ACTN|nr:MMPL family transporter [Nocardioides pinisoli]MCP3422430.1 MMPL family transporter [Nocardioides pinisoli]
MRTTAMSLKLHHLGRTAAAHPWRTICAWLVLAGAVFALAAGLGGTPQENWDIPGARAQVGVDQLREHTPGAGNATATVVVHDRDGAPLPADMLKPLADRLGALDHVVSVSPPRASADADTALLTVSYDVPVTHRDLYQDVEPLESAIAPTEEAGFQVELGGDLPETAAAPMRGTGELIGIVAALLILVLAFGSVIGAGLPVVVALGGLAVGSAGITLLAATMDVSTSAPMVASMVALGVGIDYALLLVTRFTEFLAAGHEKTEAAGRAVATAGRSVVFASATVLISLLGLRLAGLPTYDAFGFATAIAVVAVASAALTLVPALCGLLGRRLLPRKVRRARGTVGSPLMERWATRVGRRPVAWALLATTVMLTLAAPALAMRTWPQDASAQSSELTTRRAHDLVADEYGPGANGPILFVVTASKVSEAETESLAASIGGRDDMATVTPVTASPDGALRIFSAEPTFGPTDERTTELVGDLRADVPAGVEVTGTTPLFADIADLLTTRLWLVVGFVVGISVLLLGLVFRSVVVPIKAAVMNLLSIGAAYGAVTAVFQWGWGAELLGIDHPMPVSSWLPILLFAVLFGLSMDYEVFLLSRVREEWLDSGDARESVVRGLSHTGRVISAAAAIMVAVFLGFASEVDVVVKQLGLGMAVAVALDATVVRMVLVPATMTLLGRHNWWLPAWIDRMLPTVRVDVTDLDDELDELAPTRTPVGV